MACNHFQDNMVAYLYGVLPQENSRNLEQHTQTCPVCAQALEQSRSQQVLFSSWSDVPPPQGLTEKTLSRIEKTAPLPQNLIVK